MSSNLANEYCLLLPTGASKGFGVVVVVVVISSPFVVSSPGVCPSPVIACAALLDIFDKIRHPIHMANFSLIFYFSEKKKNENENKGKRNVKIEKAKEKKGIVMELQVIGLGKEKRKVGKS